MKMYFFFESITSDILFKGWVITTKWEFALSCLLFAFAAVVLEVLATLSTYLTRRYTTNPLEMNWSSPINGRSPLLAPLQIPSSVSKVKQRRCRIHFGRTIVHIVTVSLGYTVMLVVMTYNAYFLISVAVGSALGYLLFAPFRKRPKKRTPPVDRRAQRDSLTRSGQMDLGGETSGPGTDAEGSSRVNYYGTL
ncbi:probable low affinity copper uptake protein 2 [Strongylocentrotus purpuratus]|uniref:Copper transport protein n=1 Tax=Strongylocentrotus purpuratus TaxID=7668 RepID=A0A7M7PMV5_STRPU|nr:probable low affinity copper uptake protein 2 [Strongylocentrotus purpuratus]